VFGLGGRTIGSGQEGGRGGTYGVVAGRPSGVKNVTPLPLPGRGGA
jgi:hypothetical protein